MAPTKEALIACLVAVVFLSAPASAQTLTSCTWSNASNGPCYAELRYLAAALTGTPQSDTARVLARSIAFSCSGSSTCSDVQLVYPFIAARGALFCQDSLIDVLLTCRDTSEESACTANPLCTWTSSTLLTSFVRPAESSITDPAYLAWSPAKRMLEALATAVATSIFGQYPIKYPGFPASCTAKWTLNETLIANAYGQYTAEQQADMALSAITNSPHALMGAGGPFWAGSCAAATTVAGWASKCTSITAAAACTSPLASDFRVRCYWVANSTGGGRCTPMALFKELLLDFNDPWGAAFSNLVTSCRGGAQYVRQFNPADDQASCLARATTYTVAPPVVLVNWNNTPLSSWVSSPPPTASPPPPTAAPTPAPVLRSPNGAVGVGAGLSRWLLAAAVALAVAAAGPLLGGL